MATKPTKKVSNAQREAMSRGQREARVVRLYLDELEAKRGRGGSRLTPEKLRATIEELDQTIPTLRPFDRLLAVQRRADAAQILAELESEPETIEPEFIEIAAVFSERKGISYATWRELGVPATVLREAGIPATRA